MAPTELRTPHDKTLVNYVWVPHLKGISNYDAWRAKFEEAVKTDDPLSWRILNGDQRGHEWEIKELLSDRKLARIGAAKRLRLEAHAITEEQVQAFLDGHPLDAPLLRDDYVAILRSRWADKVSFALELMKSTMTADIELPNGVDDLLEWAHTRFSSMGYLARANAWERWLKLRYTAYGWDQDSCRRAFVRKFKRIQNQLEEKIGRPIPPEAEICQFLTALQRVPDQQAAFGECAANAAKLDGPIDMKAIYTEFADFNECELEDCFWSK